MLQNDSRTWNLFNNPTNTSPRLHLLPWLPVWDQTSWDTFPYFNSTCKFAKKNPTVCWWNLSHRVFPLCAGCSNLLPAVIPLWSRSCSTRRPECNAALWWRWQGSGGPWCDHSPHLNCLHTDTNPPDCLYQRDSTGSLLCCQSNSEF